MQVYKEYQHIPEPKHDPNLTPQAQLLLQVLREANDWINRSEIARRMGKSALNKWDLVLLGKLADAQLIETRQIPRHGLIGYEWQYRALLLDSDEGSAG